MTETTNSIEGPTTIVARYGRYYRNTRYLIAALAVGMGMWFLYDGLVKWPRENAENIAREQPVAHSELDLRLQKILGTTLPPLGIALLAWMLYNSRGAYRLAENVLNAPGHPPIPLDNIRKLDKRLWERKGIAVIEYEDPASGQRRQLKLDDFVYEREPTDAIFDRIEKHVADMVQQQQGTPSTS